MLIVLIGACLIGLSLGILGSGGAILTVPVLIYGLGYSEKMAIASALVIVGLISATSALKGLRQKKIQWPLVYTFGIPSMFSAYAGAWAGGYVSGPTQVLVLAIIMLVAAWRMFQSLPVPSPKKLNLLLTTMQGICIGLLTGFVGVGGGFLIVPALVLLAGITMSQAIFTSLVVISINSISGFIKYQAVLSENNQGLDWPTIAIITVIGIVGSFIGQHFSQKLPQQKIKKYFSVFLVLIAILILGQNLFIAATN